jgi:hypothetical protein
MILPKAVSFVAIVSIVQGFSTTGSLAFRSVRQNYRNENCRIAHHWRPRERVGPAFLSMGDSSSEDDFFPRINKMRALPSAKISLEVAFKEVGHKPTA